MENIDEQLKEQQKQEMLKRVNALNESYLKYSQSINKSQTNEQKNENQPLNHEISVSECIKNIDVNIESSRNNLNNATSNSKEFAKEISSVATDVAKISFLLVFVNKELNKKIEESKSKKIIESNIEPEEKNIEFEEIVIDSITEQIPIYSEPVSEDTVILEMPHEENVLEEKTVVVKKKTKKLKLKRSVSNTLLVIFLFGVLISSYNIALWYLDSKKTNRMIDEISKTVSITEEKDNNQKYEVDFEKLKSINSDVVAWIKVNGTDIEYPVVKGTDNDYYLSHSLNKEYNKAGWIFADYRDNLDGTDDNIIIYGHNMHDKTMFFSLKKVIKPEWYENKDNYKITYMTEEGKIEYQVFSTYQINAQDYETITKYDSKESFENYLNLIKNNSVYNYNVDISSDDQILTLSTCADNSSYRVVLHAKKV